ncbi:AraC family transcriptional regulator [Paraeggerthella hongkongensis]|uniref:AraC family transcriptional regulator n=2 Tax=Paraeggerthella hongkongensis TaxID=230658 RepID=A0A3N0BGL2_9ACTN|nr:AraC family transcriptional regulator [Paraeggerthella hongkongensis]
MRDIVLPCADSLGMIELSPSEAALRAIPAREGRCFSMPESQASGYFWIHAGKDFAVSVTSMTLHRDWQQRCPHPRFVALRHLRSGEYILPDTGLTVKAPYLEGHVSRTRTWICTHKASQPLHSVEIMLAPPFYERYLRAVYRDEAFSAEDAFSSIDGLASFPEMTLLLGQIEAYRGRGASAGLFYRGKVEEAVALVVDRSRNLAAASLATPGQTEHERAVSPEDARAIEHARQRLDDRLTDPVSAEELAHIACMGQTKLRRVFKRAYGCTIVEYRQRQRCARAADLLTTSDASVACVASAVGYRPERLAELFARIYGTTPSAYRESLGQAGSLTSNTIHVDAPRASTRASSAPPIRSIR